MRVVSSIAAGPILAFLLAGSPALAATPAVPGATHVRDFAFSKTLNVHEFKLANGMRVLLLPDPTVPTIAEQVWVGAGSSFEREGATGIAHLFEHMMFKETKSLKEGEFDKQLESEGGDTNASTSNDWTYYRNNIPSEALETALRLDAERFQNLVVTHESVKTEVEVVKGERRLRIENSPEGALWLKVYETAFQVHPYHHPVIGWIPDLDAMDEKECRFFYEMYYAPNVLTGILVGGFDVEKALALFVKHFGPAKPSQLPTVHLPPEPEQTAERRATVVMETSGEKVWVAYKMPEATHADAPLFDVLNEVLVGGKSSRLHRQLIEDDQTAADVEGSAETLRDPSLWMVRVNLKAGQSAAAAEQKVIAAVEKLAGAPVGGEELEKVKNRLEGAYWRQMKTPAGKASALGNSQVTFGDYRSYFDFPKRYRAATAGDVQRIAKTYLTAARRTVVTLVPPSKKPDAGKGEGK